MLKPKTIQELFFNEPTKHWHFEEILKATKISRPQVDYWLKKYIKEGMVMRIKPRNKMPYYRANYSLPTYQIKKRLYLLTLFYESGFLEHLMTLPDAQTIILFGSLSRWDWHSASDIDLFVYGSIKGLEGGKYEQILGRELQIFECKNKEEVRTLGIPLLKRIIKGEIFKGNLDFVEVCV